MDIAGALDQARHSGVERLDAQLLLLHALGRTPGERAYLIAHDRDPLDVQAARRFESLCARRRAGEPLAYLTGTRDFHGLPLRVDPRVLDPRADTETLVDWALELLPLDSPRRVLDLGTGSGAVAIAIAHHRPLTRVVATDVSADALAVARENAETHRIGIDFREGCWLQPVAGERFDLVVSNPPYVAADDPHLPALRHEPRLALAAGADGLDAIRVICEQAPAHLHPGSWLLLEHGHDQAARVRALLQAAGLANVQSRQDLAGIERCSGGSRCP